MNSGSNYEPGTPNTHSQHAVLVLRLHTLHMETVMFAEKMDTSKQLTQLKLENQDYILGTSQETYGHEHLQSSDSVKR